MENLPAGIYNVTASKEGYDTQTKVATVKAAVSQTADFQLSEIVVEMPDTVSVTATSDIPLWYFDEAGGAKIPCTRNNPVKKGAWFSIAVSEKGEEDKTIIHRVDDATSVTYRSFAKTLFDAPSHLRGTYKGEIDVDGDAGTVHVTITEYAIYFTKKVKISCDQDASIYVNGELKHTPTIGRLTKVLHELR